MIQKTSKRRLCALLLVAVLGFSFFFSCFPVKTSAAEAPQSYDDTPIESDMANMEEANYPANALGKCSIVGFMEYCYSENSAYSPFYGLYVYVYNPTEKPLSLHDGSNKILMSNAFGEDGERSGTKTYSLTYLDRTDDHRFYKFKITDSPEQYEIVKDYASKWSGRRRYEITSLDIRFDGNIDTETFGISKVYEYSGYAAWCGEPAVAVSTLACQYYGAQDVHLQVFDTNYRGAHKGDFLYDDLQSVYFSLPNEYSSQWGNLSKITAEWYQYKTTPMFVTTYMQAYSGLFNMRNQKINEYGQLLDDNGTIVKDTLSYWRVFWDITRRSDISGMTGLHYYIGKTYNGRCRDDVDDDSVFDSDNSANWHFGEVLVNDSISYDYSFLSRLDWIFPITEEIESLDDYEVSSEEVKEYIKRYANAYPNQEKLHDKYPVNLFERYSGDGYKNNAFFITDAKSFVDKNENRSLWEQLWGMNTTSDFPYSPIATISEGDLFLSAEDFSKKYLVNKNDSDKIIEFAKESYDKNETPMLLRFAKTDYYASPAIFDYSEEEGFSLPEVNGYVAQEHLFINFDILSLEYTSEDGFKKTVVGVVADSIDIINGLTAPENMPTEDQEWWQKLMLMLCIILVLVVLSVFWGPLTIVLKVVFTGIRALFSILWALLTLPFRLIFGLLFSGRR